MTPCLRCGGVRDVGTHGLCGPCFEADHLERCAAEGVDPVITDPIALDRVARILRAPTAVALDTPAAVTPHAAPAGVSSGPADGSTAAPTHGWEDVQPSDDHALPAAARVDRTPA